jgi:soluble lytic murein transglycosylase
MKNSLFFRLFRTSVFRFLLLISCLLPTSCAAASTGWNSEEEALKILRDLTKDGKLPSEALVLEIERRYSRTKTGALAKLLRAWIRFENADFEGAADVLNSDVFSQKTKLADYALWLRGRALQNAGKHAEAMKNFSQIIQQFPTSLRRREAKILWANSALASGQASQIPDFLRDLSEKKQADALLLTAKAFEAEGNQAEAVKFYRKVFFYGAGSSEAREAEAKLTLWQQPLTPQTAEEITVRAEKFYEAGNFVEAEKSFAILATNFPGSLTPALQLKRLVTFANLKKMAEANEIFLTIPEKAKEKEKAYYELALGYAKNRLWSQTRATLEEMRRVFPSGKLTPKAWIDAGMVARDAKNKTEESYYLQTAVTAYPNAVDVAKAQFELAWLQHENKNFQLSSQMLIEHLARYADKDSSNRGRAGYWAARDSEKAGKISEACALYEAVIYRYAANWYGYLGMQRLTALRREGKCQTSPNFPQNSLVSKAAANLKIVTVAAETATEKELERAEKSEELSTVGLFDWAIDELKEAGKTAGNSPKINLALARHYRLKSDNVNALLSLAKSYPDYPQMFPEEMGQAEWDIFYPLTHWNDIKYWAAQRRLDHYLVAGLIRQESVFNPTARSAANAFGLMQLLVPTAQAMARKYGSSETVTDGNSLYNPSLNIELGTAYMREQLDKYGRIEYMAVAYNAGPGRVVQWRSSLPLEIDEYVEAIPFRETKGYVQGIIRNTAQYRRLYDENGKFRSNVGSRPLRGEIDSKTREQFAREFPDIVLDDGKSGE